MSWQPQSIVLELGGFKTDSEPPQIGYRVQHFDGSCEWVRDRITGIISKLFELGQIVDFLDNKYVVTYLIKHWSAYRGIYAESKYGDTWDRLIKKLGKKLEARHKETFICSIRKTRWDRDKSELRRYQYAVVWLNREGKSWEEGINKGELYDRLVELGQLELFGEHLI
ncbi:hypothetical protein BNJ_00203 [Kaumoebavirus]|uniref:hypothetical protein n=1 Tax=Kaumoebavirus TaxID=1859492 RepID=UPI0009C36C41|nr:hypothetical protein BNJ_00203 [Kaumoebavirus]ARA72034.1 hypothetical protein BNJ_00203 [Kaumoebavirus]